MLVCLAVLCALVLSPELRLYIDQQREITALEREVAEYERAVGGLDDEVVAWSDDAYVAAQARERLRYVYPGETGYVTGNDVLDEALDPRSEAALAGRRENGDGRSTPMPEGTWFGRVWGSIEASGTGAADPVLDDPLFAEPSAGQGASGGNE